MKTTIFIKTYSGDAEYHPYCIRSIEKFCTGFQSTVVVHNDEPRGYATQQWYKMNADRYCPDTDFILITDSDTLFTEPVTPESFMRDGKPIWFYTPFNEAMRQDKNVRCWIDVMTKFVGQVPEAEKMRRQPFMFPVGLFAEFRAFCQQRHGKDLLQYILDESHFSEFNCFGFWAWLHRRDAFSWINTEEELPPAKVRQFWSHDPISKNLDEIKQILA